VSTTHVRRYSHRPSHDEPCESYHGTPVYCPMSGPMDHLHEYIVDIESTLSYEQQHQCNQHVAGHSAECAVVLARSYQRAFVLTTDFRDFAAYRVPFASPEGAVHM